MSIQPLNNLLIADGVISDCYICESALEIVFVDTLDGIYSKTMHSHQHEYILDLRKIDPDLFKEEVRQKRFVLKESIDQLRGLEKCITCRFLHEFEKAIASGATIKHMIIIILGLA